MYGLLCPFINSISGFYHIPCTVGCGLPTPPPRGSLGDLTSSQEGAVVAFQCNPGLVPSQQMMSVCAANGSWTPDPAEHVCRGTSISINVHGYQNAPEMILMLPLVYTYPCSLVSHAPRQRTLAFP